MNSNYRINDILNALNKVGINIFDVMVTGVTGAGKSTTLNAILESNQAKVGYGSDPETRDICHYLLNDQFRLWDTPGLGDGIYNDQQHAEKIIKLLNKTYSSNYSYQQYGFIDLVLVIIEGSNKDMGTTYKLLNNIIIPNFPKDRILVAINQADIAMKGRYWNTNSYYPYNELQIFLEDFARSIQRRIKESTGVEIIKPIYYSAKYNYNIKKLLDHIIDNLPIEKRPI